MLLRSGLSMNYRNLAGFSLAAETKMAKEPVFQQYKGIFTINIVWLQEAENLIFKIGGDILAELLRPFPIR